MASVPNDDIDILAKAKRALDRDYAPSDDEEYMSAQQLNYFRVLLLEWRKSILSAAENTLQSLQTRANTAGARSPASRSASTG